MIEEDWQNLESALSGDLYFDTLWRNLYATDASEYRLLPRAVACPRNKQDIAHLIVFANAHEISLIPRSGGTSLAGQCVGEGIVVDVSQYMNRILEYNESESWVIVEPGVIRDDLNRELLPHGLFFGPITSTSNRATIGGMVGNNAAGTTSIRYGSTRDHVLEIEMLLSDGSEVSFGPLTENQLRNKRELDNLEGRIYKRIDSWLRDSNITTAIEKNFPKSSIHRRNTGYALDALLSMFPYSQSGQTFNLCKLICGSEGTLGFITKIKLHLDPLPPTHPILIAAHFSSMHHCLESVKTAMEANPTMCELIDDIILRCTESSKQQKQNRFFIEGTPKAILLIELRAESMGSVQSLAQSLITKLEQLDHPPYATPIINSVDIPRIHELRKAGLGLLANLSGDHRAVACTEDTAVSLEDLPEYIQEFRDLLAKYGQEPVIYAHAGAGELHLRPLLNLKSDIDRARFYELSLESAQLVKKFRGSLSGEHGDGRLRAPFIPLVMGQEIYELFIDLKMLFDPKNIFNPGKIVHPPSMNKNLRYDDYEPVDIEPKSISLFENGNMLEAVERCNGSGDCRKTALADGTMCPSYQASRSEKDSTRGRANILREMLSKPKELELKDAAFEALKLCISCKACALECPSNIDMASMKAEFIHRYYQSHLRPVRDRIFLLLPRMNSLLKPIKGLYNFSAKQKVVSHGLKKIMGIHPSRTLPLLQPLNWRRELRNHASKESARSLYLYIDTFTKYNDGIIGVAAIRLLQGLGYRLKIIKHPQSGRIAFSKGSLDAAKQYAQKNVAIFSSLISEESPLVGIEPSAILSFRDEYPRLLRGVERETAQKLSNYCLTLEEFVYREYQAGYISEDAFHEKAMRIAVHEHCHQKALSKRGTTASICSIPKNYEAQLLDTGCCGMAGSFGYEIENYEMSKKIAELKLLPSLKSLKQDYQIVAPGTSCRHQIADLTYKKSVHPAELLYRALR